MKGAYGISRANEHLQCHRGPHVHIIPDKAPGIIGLGPDTLVHLYQKIVQKGRLSRGESSLRGCGATSYIVDGDFRERPLPTLDGRSPFQNMDIAWWNRRWITEWWIFSRFPNRSQQKRNPFLSETSDRLGGRGFRFEQNVQARAVLTLNDREAGTRQTRSSPTLRSKPT